MVRDPVAQVPYTYYNSEWISFDDEVSLTNKVRDDNSEFFYQHKLSEMCMIKACNYVGILSFNQCNFIKDKRFGGGMIWALGTDDFNGKSCGGRPSPLVSTISSCLGISGSDRTTDSNPSSFSPTTTASTTSTSTTPSTTTKSPICSAGNLRKLENYG